ncbi:MAG: ABC transporter ATP-binding protein [Eubacterium sp.]|nr:ABC transporter ATP-binding protein [Eubacterium sp.]
MANVDKSEINLTVSKGEIVGITGRNGSGKTTFARYLAGEIRPETMGMVHINGLDTYSQLDREKVQRMSAVAYQSPREAMVFDNISRDIIFGSENHGLDAEKTLKRGSFYLKKYNLRSRKNASYYSVSASEQQRAMLCSMLIMHPELLILDEPFSMHGSPDVTGYVKSLIAAARKKEQTVIIFSKNPDVLKLTDVTYELSGGFLREVDISSFDYLPKQEGVKTIYGDKTPKGVAVERYIDGGRGKNDIGISLHNVSFGYNENLIIDRVNTRFEAGSAYRITGGQGSGKTTFLMLAAGLIRPYEGEVFRSENTRIGYVYEYPDDGFVESTVLDDVMFGPMKGGFGKSEARGMAEAVLGFVGLDKSLWTRRLSTLSFGERKLVGVAGAICLNPDFLLIDNPYAGLDRDYCKHMSDIFEGLTREGKCIITAENRA